MKTEDIIKKLNETKAAETLHKIAENPSNDSENEIENAVNDLVEESLKLEG